MSGCSNTNIFEVKQQTYVIIRNEAVIAKSSLAYCTIDWMGKCAWKIMLRI